MSAPSGSLGNGSSSQTAVYSFSIPTAGGFAPNGNILQANDVVNGNWVYTYDSFNRLSSAVAAAKGLGCGWVYDRYGNRWQQNPYTGTCGSDQRTYTMNGAGTNNNRMDAASYDALGNLMVNPSGGGSYVYDAESRLIQAGGLKYIYDAEGRRVAKLSGTTVTNEYLFDTDGSQQIELNGSGAVLHTNLYAGGKLIATYQGTNTYFHFTDWLGTRRYEANSAGAQTEICTNLPFGDSQSCTGTPDATEQHFTGKEHDTESGLDYFGARYYANMLGRFTSPDLPFADQHQANPQTWNLYMYVANNPLRNTDPNGRGIIDWVALGNSIKSWFDSGVKRDGGVANFVKNNGIGAAKGTGSFVVNTAKAGVALGQAASGNPAGAVQTVMTPNPKALQPSNQTQAQASTATQVTLTVATAAIPIGGTETAAITETTNLFRAVDSAEAASIDSLGGFSGSPNGSEFKGFFFNESDASSFASRMTDLTGDSHTVVSASAPTDLVNASPMHDAATEGPGVLIENGNLPLVKPTLPK